jgi:cytochrome c oxidase subunit 3/cytochrome o ubiquinol oxidase subunit 3
VLEVPVFNTVCLLSSSASIWMAERKLAQGALKSFAALWGLTFALGAIFLKGTAMEWHRLIYHDGLTVRTNVFGTTFYSLVGLHGLHVIVGLSMILLVLIFAVTGKMSRRHEERVKVLSLYWHFVDAVWVIVFTVVYVAGR